MKTKTFTSQEVGEWLVTFHKYHTAEEYRVILRTVRLMFNAEWDEEFWDEVCKVATQK